MSACFFPDLAAEAPMVPRVPLLVEVAVPVSKIQGALTYAVPEALAKQAVPGVRVRVPVGGRRMVGVIVERCTKARTAGHRLRPLERVLDEQPVVTEEQLALCRFVSEYYLAPLGEALRLVLPPDTERDIRRRYRLTERGRTAAVLGAAHGLSPKEMQALAAFEEGEHKAEAQLLRLGVSRRRLEVFVGKGLLERVESAGKAGARVVERLLPLEGGEPLPPRAFALAALDEWIRAQPMPPTLDEARVLFSAARGKVRRLVALGRLRVEKEAPAPRLFAQLGAGEPPTKLTGAQTSAVRAILEGEGPGAFLLEGVTGSGKTEVYLRVLQETLRRGKGAILVVPEIALTPQLFSRVQAGIEAEVAVLHSALTLAERRDALSRLRAAKARVALGARSALFAPVRDLGLIVVDEEHDGSLKQEETPRYHARDVALWRGRNEGARVILGSATPSLESRLNARLGKLVHLSLPARIGGGGALPEVKIVDLRTRREMHEARARDRAVSEGGPGTILSGPLLEALEETLAAKDQALLFLNRRGYAAFVLCEACGHIRECPNCSVSLTLHRGRERLLCHQCDHEERLPDRCEGCGASSLLALGLGTERVEAEVRARFPDARVARLDRDTARRRGALAKILESVARREVDVLIGTQMVAKGHDFPGIALVGVVLADVALAIPDFRAAERAFSLLTQVAGRAGRGDRPGRVLVQTYNPEHPAIAFAKEHDVEGFAEAELKEREARRYPPFWRAAQVRVEGEDPTAVDALARRVGERLRAEGRAHLSPGTWDVLGPAPAPLERLRGMTRHHLFVRARGVAPRRQLLSALLADDTLDRALARARCRLVLDVDPAHVL